MLSYALAIAVAISSLILFSTAFFMSKIHRKDDFLWSAVGLFYALILWFCARNITGTVLLGQAAATVLIISYCWQTIKLRRAIANPALAMETNNFSVVRSFNRLFKRKPKLESPAAPMVKPPTPKVTEQDIAIPETPGATPPQTSEVPIPVAEETIKSDAARSWGFPAEATQLLSEQSPEGTLARKRSSTKDLSACSDRVISDSQPTQAIKPRPDKVDNLEQVTSQPLPNKLPETIAKTQPLPAGKPQPEQPIQPIEQIDNLVTEAAEAVNPNSQTETNIAREKIDSVPQSKVEPAPEVITPEVTKGQIDNVPQSEVKPAPEAITPEIKTESSFDSLEIVEVAEVLEAEIDNDLNQRESDEDNIIEVTTTDINIVTETNKIDRNQIDDSDLS